MSIEAALMESRIRELKPSRPVCVDRAATLAEALDSMRARGSACLLICEDGRVSGIFTERDLLNKIAGEEVSLDSPLEDFSTPHPKTLGADDSLGDAIRLMDQGDYRHVPVVDRSGKVEGVISIQDIIDYLTALFPTEVLNLPPRPDQSMNSQEGG